VLDLLLYIVVVALVLGVLYWVTTLFPLPHPFPLIIRAVFALIAVLFVVHILLGLMGSGDHYPMLRRY
jgi:VIT1/CCC1 family predicted Fe2+/Mn2+ transporter